MWKYTGQERPPFAEPTTKGQESVWDYPRPPALERSDSEVVIRIGKVVLAHSHAAIRVLETASPPGYYLPTKDIDMTLLLQSRGSSFCEWKGQAAYWVLADKPSAPPVGWNYPEPTPDFVLIRQHLSFYPGRVDCYLDGEKVRPQPGIFYGGWISRGLAGPFKGDPGTGHW